MGKSRFLEGRISGERVFEEGLISGERRFVLTIF